MSKKNEVDFERLSPEVIELLKAAKEVAKTSYNKYSDFYVGAAVRTKSGKIYTGSCMENASYGLTLCAETTAIANANSNGDFNIVSIAVVGGYIDDNNDSPPVTPCGRCRQIIFEAARVAESNISVYCSNINFTRVLSTSIEELLPYAFFL